MAWVLIVLWASGSMIPASTAIAFSSADLCETAKTAILADFAKTRVAAAISADCYIQTATDH